MADRVMRMKAPGGTCAECAEDESKMEAVQGGRPLTSSERYFFEPRFQSDFSRVRLHTGSTADAAARSMGALAYTRGSDIVFREGSYAPGAPGSRRLLAHELTHVAQQGGAAGPRVQRQEEAATEVEPAPMEEPVRLAGEPRRSPSCSGANALPISETLPPFVRGAVFSLPFHAPAGRTISVDVAAEYLSGPSGSFRDTFGVDVMQCCVVSDSRVTPTQTVSTIGNPGHPTHVRMTVALTDECTWSSRHGDDFIYYLRIFSASQTDQVSISYTVS